MLSLLLPLYLLPFMAFFAESTRLARSTKTAGAATFLSVRFDAEATFAFATLHVPRCYLLSRYFIILS